MKIQSRNKVQIAYKNYTGTTEVMDGAYSTGEYKETYSASTNIMASVSTPSGTSRLEEFGLLPEYDYQIIIDDTGITVNETTRFTIDSQDYQVIKVAKTFNYIAVAVKRLA